MRNHKYPDFVEALFKQYRDEPLDFNLMTIADILEEKGDDRYLAIREMF